MEKFETAFRKFLSSIEQKNIGEFKKFLNPNVETVIILPKEHPHGPEIKGYQNVLEEIRKLFSNSDNDLSFKIQNMEASEDLGFGAVKASIRLKEINKPEYKQEVYISYLFRRIENQWILIHDQNTILK